MSATDADRKRELKKKLDDAKAVAKQNAKSPKQKAKEKKEADEQAKKDKAAQEEQAKIDAEKARLRVPVVPPEPSIWTGPGEELQEIGIHIGITCDGCGDGPPLIGRTFKCKVCPDFDLCQTCFPLRLDRHREAVAAAAGMSGRGKHPNHDFGARRAKSVMTAEAAGKEIVAAEQDKRRREQETKARVERGEEKKPVISAAGMDVASLLSAAKSLKGASVAPWTPILRLAKELPVPSGPPCEFGPSF